MIMDALDLIHEKFSQDCAIETVRNLVMAEYGLTEEEAQKKIEEYFEIIEEGQRLRNSDGK